MGRRNSGFHRDKPAGRHANIIHFFPTYYIEIPHKFGPKGNNPPYGKIHQSVSTNFLRLLWARPSGFVPQAGLRRDTKADPKWANQVGHSVKRQVSRQFATDFEISRVAPYYRMRLPRKIERWGKITGNPDVGMANLCSCDLSGFESTLRRDNAADKAIQGESLAPKCANCFIEHRHREMQPAWPLRASARAASW
jgi:hypothetical protein